MKIECKYKTRGLAWSLPRAEDEKLYHANIVIGTWPTKVGVRSPVTNTRDNLAHNNNKKWQCHPHGTAGKLMAGHIPDFKPVGGETAQHANRLPCSSGCQIRPRESSLSQTERTRTCTDTSTSSSVTFEVTWKVLKSLLQQMTPGKCHRCCQWSLRCHGDSSLKERRCHQPPWASCPGRLMPIQM